MKVYVLIMERTYGIYNELDCVGVYDTEEKAQGAMEEEIDHIKNRWLKSEKNVAHVYIKISKGEGTISLDDKCRYYIIEEKEIK